MIRAVMMGGAKGKFVTELEIDHGEQGGREGGDRGGERGRGTAQEAGVLLAGR